MQIAKCASPDWATLNLIGDSKVFRAVLELLQQWASVDATVLLCGETGTGKELAARAIHYLSARRHGPFVPVNCGAIPDALLESELFGHVRGAFTDAKRGSAGVIRHAQGGTLFLDEVDALSARGQAAILRFAQDHSYRPVGAPYFEQGDMRIIAATNADLEARCDAGQFRRDLLFRLNLLTVELPPLRDRDGDALLLAQAFVRRFSQQYRTGEKHLHGASVAALQRSRTWPVRRVQGAGDRRVRTPLRRRTARRGERQPEPGRTAGRQGTQPLRQAGEEVRPATRRLRRHPGRARVLTPRVRRGRRGGADRPQVRCAPRHRGTAARQGVGRRRRSRSRGTPASP
jgi:transcriptional regulator with GAF, ATPase, and Fis domain